MKIDDKIPRIGIIGGLGRMGRWFAEFFRQAGFPVLISDLDTDISCEDLAGLCRVFIVSVPMEALPDVVSRLGPLLPEESFMTDLCSLKQMQVACMLEHTSCEVTGTHPLWVQALNHFILLCLGKTFDKDGVDLQQVLALATPSFERQMDILARLCPQDPELYATIQLANPNTNKVIERFGQYEEELRGIIRHGDRAGFIEIFKEVQHVGHALLHIRDVK